MNLNLIITVILFITLVITCSIICFQQYYYKKVIKNGQIIKTTEQEAKQIKKEYFQEKELYVQKLKEEEEKFKKELDYYNQQYADILNSVHQIICSNKEYNCINISKENQEDIDYLLNHVISKLTNKNIIYKLIWSEFYQKPVNEMLNAILPFPEISGIYMITNKNTQQSYIGKSVNVKKRLIDHIKGSIGILNISDQRIHHIMREEGIWNFSFKLIEECSREQLSQREKFYINFFKTNIKGYNDRAGG